MTRMKQIAIGAVILLCVGLTCWGQIRTWRAEKAAVEHAAAAKAALQTVQHEDSVIVRLQITKDSALALAAQAHAAAVASARRAAQRVLPTPQDRPDTCKAWIAAVVARDSSLHDNAVAIERLTEENIELQVALKSDSISLASARRALAAAMPVLVGDTVVVRTSTGPHLLGIKIPMPKITVGYGAMPSVESGTLKFRMGPTVSIGFNIPIPLGGSR